MFVSVMLQQYVNAVDLRRLWFAVAGRFHKRFPDLASGSYMLLHKQVPQADCSSFSRPKSGAAGALQAFRRSARPRGPGASQD